MLQKITPFLMFDGKAELAMTFYASLFADSKIVDIERYDRGGPGVEGAVMHATISLAGQQVICIDSPVQQPFGLTPAFSLFVNCDSVEEITRLAGALAGAVARSSCRSTPIRLRRNSLGWPIASACPGN